MMKLIVTLLLTVSLSFAAQPSVAQDANYWTNQYGNEARLLGGAVVGSSKDVAAVYYNPGRLALIGDPELLLAGNVIRFSSISVEDALGPGTDFTSQRLGGAPSLFAGELNFDKDGKNRFAYSFLTRQDFALNLELRAQLEDAYPIPVDLLAVNGNFRGAMAEYWAGFTWSRAVSKKVGVGATVFGLFRDQSSDLMTLTQAKVDSLGGISVQQNDYAYQYMGVLVKLGIGADLGAWRAGLSVTSPNLKIYGTGEYGYDDSAVGQDIDRNGIQTSQILTGYQKDVATDYHSPTSVAAGVGYTWMKTYVDITVEWFDAVPQYIVMDTAPASSVDGSVTIHNDVYDVRKSVTNFGIGVEHVFSERVQGYLSFRTDKSAAVRNDQQTLNISNWDIEHIAGGATFPIGKSTFTVGMVYSAGSNVRPREFALLPDPAPGDPELELPEQLRVKYTQLTFILGFNISF